MLAPEITIRDDSWLEICNIANGTFSPLSGFMTKKDYDSVVNDMHLNNASPWTIPITLEIPEESKNTITKSNTLILKNTCGLAVAQLDVEDVFTINSASDLKKIFGTDDKNHPGVAMEKSLSPLRVGGRISLKIQQEDLFPEISLSPSQTKAVFKERNWKTIVGFQTRNPIHRAHEYLQRVAMELCDGILLHPLIGWKKGDDFSPKAVIAAYQKQISEFYPNERVLLSALRTPMRYAGPREAVFHAIVRRNHGCTHFIVGRDHAGVGNFYKTYEAQSLCAQFTNLGIEILHLKGPYFCSKCDQIVTEKTCPHGDKYTVSISGTKVRQMLSCGTRPPEHYMRKEIADVLCDLSKNGELFVKTREGLLQEPKI